jgi:hypothetical protein
MIHLQGPRAGNTRASTADIECLREFDELHPGCIPAAQQHGNLKTNSLCSASLARVQNMPFKK